MEMPPHPNTSLGAYLKQRRKRFGFSQSDVASTVGLSSAQVSRIESDITVSLSIDTAKAFAHKLLVHPVYVWAYERRAGLHTALLGFVSQRLLQLPVNATRADAAEIVFSEVRQAHPWVETMSIGVAETDPNLQNGVIRWYHAPEVVESATLTGRRTDTQTVVEDGVLDDTVPAHCPPGHEHHEEAKAELVEYLEAWRAGKVLSHYDLHSWWQGLEGPVTCISEPFGQVIIDHQILGHKPAPTPRLLGVAAVLDRYFSLTGSARSSGDDIEARVSRLEVQLAQSNGDTAVSSGMH